MTLGQIQLLFGVDKEYQLWSQMPCEVQHVPYYLVLRYPTLRLFSFGYMDS